MSPLSNKPQEVERLLSLPSVLWLTLFFLLPLFFLIGISFKTPSLYGGIGTGWTLENFFKLSVPSYPTIILRTLIFSVLNTTLCLLIATPVAYYMARAQKKVKNLLLLLMMIPFWINFLILISAWKIVLHPEGLFHSLLVILHLIEADTVLLYSNGAVLLVMVYSFLPFAVMPIYSAAENFDFSLVEAAQDLGAKPHIAFRKVFLPGIKQGLISAIIMVFIPTLGAYVIPDIVGGTNAQMIGSKIAEKTFMDRNLPHASALSTLLTLMVSLPFLISFFLKRRKNEEVPS